MRLLAFALACTILLVFTGATGYAVPRKHCMSQSCAAHHKPAGQKQEKPKDCGCKPVTGFCFCSFLHPAQSLCFIMQGKIIIRAKSDAAVKTGFADSALHPPEFV